MRKLIYLSLILISTNYCFAETPGVGIQTGADSDTALLVHLNAGTDTTAYELSGNHRNGTITGALWVDGVWGKCLEFADAQYIDFGVEDYLSGVKNLTISAWVYFPAWGDYMTVFKKLNVVWLAFNAETPGKMFFWNGNGAAWTHGWDITARPYEANKWFHIAVTQDGVYGKMYIDGVRVSEWGNLTAALPASANNSYLSNTDTQAMNGKIEEFKMVLRTVSDGEIWNEYQRAVEGYR